MEPTKEATDQSYYKPHHCFINQVKVTSKVRVKYNVTAGSSGPSLKDWLYTGPKLRVSLSDMLLCFLLQRIALT